MNDKQTLKLEAGKFYRTRDGRKAFVAAIGCPFESVPTANQAIGWVASETNTDGCGWDREGFYFDNHEVSRRDLVAEWVEPKRIKGFIGIGRDVRTHVRCTHIHPTKEAALSFLKGFAYNDNAFAVIEIDVLEGTGLNGEAA